MSYPKVGSFGIASEPLKFSPFFQNNNDGEGDVFRNNNFLLLDGEFFLLLDGTHLLLLGT